MTSEERRHEEQNRKRLNYIHTGYVHFSRRVGVVLAMQSVVLIASLAILGFLVKENYDKTVHIKAIALHASAKAEEARTLQLLAKEKVCSQSSNQKVACRALFDRLARHISQGQAHRLACKVLSQIPDSTARELSHDAKC